MSLSQLHTEIQHLDLFVSLAAQGLAGGADAVRWMELHRETAEVLGRPDPFPDADSYDAARKRAEEVQAFAAEQQTQGYPYLYELATIKLWSLLEHCVDELVIHGLDDLSLCTDQEMVRSIKGPLLDFVEASEELRAEFLAGELKQLTRSRLKVGVGAFESVLDPVGLGGGVDADVRRTLLELSQVRHLLVHKLGIIDTRFATSCPWLGLSPKKRLVIQRVQYDEYVLGCHWYLLELNQRMSAREGIEPTPRQPKIQELLVTRIKALRTPDRESLTD